MEVTLKIRSGGQVLEAAFHSNIEAIEVYAKLWDALLDGNNPGGFEISLEVNND